MGFLGPEKYIISDLELEQDPRSNIRTPNGKYSTSVDKVFAAGGKYAVFTIMPSLCPYEAKNNGIHLWYLKVIVTKPQSSCHWFKFISL